MVIFNYSEKQISAKIVYYGPGLGGKTTSLSYIHDILDEKDRGEMLSLATDADRTLYFDYLPVSLGKINEILNIKLQLYTVPGQIRYNNTRRVVLSGADAIVFVADSQRERYDANVESYKNMKINLLANHINPDAIPIVIQYNKRDLPNIIPVDELESIINERKVPYYPTIATTGIGVIEAFHEIGVMLLHHIADKYKVKIQTLTEDVFSVKEVSDENTAKFEELKKNDEKAREEEKKKGEEIPVSLDLTQDEDFDFGELDNEFEQGIEQSSDDNYGEMSIFPSQERDHEKTGQQEQDAEEAEVDFSSRELMKLKSDIDRIRSDNETILRNQSEILDLLYDISRKLDKHQ